MAKTFQVDIVTPESVVWSGQAEMVSARTTEGDIGVLADHEPVARSIDQDRALAPKSLCEQRQAGRRHRQSSSTVVPRLAITRSTSAGSV